MFPTSTTSQRSGGSTDAGRSGPGTRPTGRDHKGVNPMRPVAAGAAIQAGVLKGDVKDICCSTGLF